MNVAVFGRKRCSCFLSVGFLIDRPVDVPGQVIMMEEAKRMASLGGNAELPLLEFVSQDNPSDKISPDFRIGTSFVNVNTASSMLRSSSLSPKRSTRTSNLQNGAVPLVLTKPRPVHHESAPDDFKKLANKQTKSVKFFSDTKSAGVLPQQMWMCEELRNEPEIVAESRRHFSPFNDRENSRFSWSRHDIRQSPSHIRSSNFSADSSCYVPSSPPLLNLDSCGKLPKLVQQDTFTDDSMDTLSDLSLPAYRDDGVSSPESSASGLGIVRPRIRSRNVTPVASVFHNCDGQDLTDSDSELVVVSL